MLNIEDAQLLKFPQKNPHKNKVPDSASHFEKLLDKWFIGRDKCMNVLFLAELLRATYRRIID